MHDFVCFVDQSISAQMTVHLVLDHFGLKLVCENMLQSHCDMMLCSNFTVNVSFERLNEYFDNHTFRKLQNINRNGQNMEIV